MCSKGKEKKKKKVKKERQDVEMRNITQEYEGIIFERISKRKAKKLFADGKEVYIAPSNMRFGMFFEPYNMQNTLTPYEYDLIDAGETSRDEIFEKCVDRYEIYNCINSETGRKASFYEKNN